MSQIQCKDVVLGYDKIVLSTRINFEVNKGDYIMVLGEKRTGKSMLLECLAGITKTMDGKIKYGEGVKTGNIAYMPQSIGLANDSTVKVFDFCLSGCLQGAGFHPFFTGKDKKKTEEMLETFGILDLKDRVMAELSGGQQKRVFLARTFLTSAQVMLLDEPTAGLDAVAVKNIYELISKKNIEGTSVIVVPKNIQHAETYCSHVLTLGAFPSFTESRK